MLERFIAFVALIALAGCDGSSEESRASTPAGSCPDSLLADASLTTFDVPPALRDRDRILRRIQEAYPTDLRDEGIGGNVRVRFLVGSDGTVRQTGIVETSGHPRLDSLARLLAEDFEFDPAYRDTSAVCAWISFAVPFDPPDTE